MGKENQRVTITKQMLKTGFMNLAKKKSVDRISVLELCKESGINRATFYRHYQEPRDILIEMEKELFTEMWDTIDRPSSLEDLEHYLEQVCNYFIEHSKLLELLILNHSDAVFVRVLNEIYAETWKHASGLQAFKAFDDESAKIFALYAGGGSYYILRSWLLGEIKKTPKEIAALSYSLLINTDWKEMVMQLSQLEVVSGAT